MSAHGWSVVRITWRQLLHEPEPVAADLRRLLRWGRSRRPRLGPARL